MLSASEMRRPDPMLAAILWTIAGCIAIAALAFLLYGAFHEAAIMDELAHIPAGYGYVHELDFRLNPEHPPLVKALAALPLLAFQPNFPTENAAWTTAVNGQWDMGTEFLYRSGNDANLIVRAARLGPILLTLLLILFTYFWSRKIMGGAWALLPTFLVAFSPVVLAHGHYVTTDIGAAFGVLLASYFFLKSLQAPSWRNLLLAGLALGIAELMKFSMVLLIPYFVLLTLVHFFLDMRGVRGKELWRLVLRKAGRLALVLIVALAVIYIVYAPFMLRYPQEKQVADTQAILGALATDGCKGLLSCGAIVNLWLTEHTATRPLAEYFLGFLMVFQRATGGNTAYFLGRVAAAGSHFYFPGVYLLKESLPALAIVLVALIFALGRMFRQVVRGGTRAAVGMYLRANFTEFALMLFALIYWAYSVKSPLNIGVRHLLPVIPLMYMLAAGFWKKWVVGFRLDLSGSSLSALWSVAKSVATSALKLSVLVVLVGWTMLETFVAAPHFLPYFNQIGGGVWGGYRYVTDSNYDWGQDLLRLRDFVHAHPEIDKIAVDYFGGGLPSYYLGEREVDWRSNKGSPVAAGVHWVAVSANFLQNSIQPAAPGFNRSPEEEYRWLIEARGRESGMGGVPVPDFRPGPSIFVYKL